MIQRALIALCLLSSVAHAQEPPVGVWAGQLMTFDFDTEEETGFQGWLDLHERMTGSTFTAIVRPGVGYAFGKGLSLWAGYGWIPVMSGDTVRHEHRIWQQFVAKGSAGPVSGMGRVRVEQRFVGEEPKVGHRIRAFGRMGVAALPTFGVSLWDEAFFHLNRTSFSEPGFNQNRLFIGPYLKSPTGWRVEVGYLNLLVGGNDLAVRHLVAANVFLPFSAPKPR